jgi:hypothetical protein
MSFDISLQTADTLYKWGWWGSLAGALLTAVAVALLMWGTKVRDRDAATQITDAKTAATQANHRAATLEASAAGWSLAPEAQSRLAEKLKPFTKSPFDLAVNPKEYRFMETMDDILRSAGWVRQQPKSDNPIFNVLLDGKASINYSSGITVEFALNRLKDFGPPAEALVKGLIAEGIPAKGNAFQQGGDPSAIHIVIGNRE